MVDLRSQEISHRADISFKAEGPACDRLPLSSLTAKQKHSKFYLAITNGHMSSLRKAVAA